MHVGVCEYMVMCVGTMCRGAYLRIRGHPCGVSPPLLLSFRVWRFSLGNQAQQQQIPFTCEPSHWLTNKIVFEQCYATCHLHVTMAEWSSRVHEIQYVFKIYSKYICKV